MDQEMTVADLITLLQKEDPTKNVILYVKEKLDLKEYTVNTNLVSGNFCVFLTMGHKLI